MPQLEADEYHLDIGSNVVERLVEFDCPFVLDLVVLAAVAERPGRSVTAPRGEKLDRITVRPVELLRVNS
jgi:hypothetical protein